MSTILPLTQNAKLVNPDGTFTPEFKFYLDNILNRVGGVTGGTYNALTVQSGVFLWDLNQAPVAVVVLTNGVNTLTPPLDLIAGGFYRLTIIQPASGAAGTISWPKPPFLFPGGVQPTLSTANNALDECWFSCDGTNMKLMVFGKNFS